MVKYKKQLMLAALVLLGTSVGAQAQKVSLNMNSTTISKAMSALHKQTGYSFVYNADALRTDRKISVHATDLRQAVDQIIDGSGLEYDIRDKNIILRKKVNGSSNANQRTQQSKNRTVKGRVTDSNGDPIIGATIKVKGANTGTISDLDGNFTLDAAQGDVLEISFIGFADKELTLGNNVDNLQVNLTEDNKLLNEVVVVGYGTMKKSDLTGSVSDVRSEDFNKGLVTSPSQLIQGRTAGINVTNNGGEPGGGVTIRVRGSNSIRSGQDPLYVIDGVPLNASTDLQATGGSVTGVGSSSFTNPLNYLNPDDIESISILKDASASAIYGSRAANGVILITTKKSVQGKAQVCYSGTATVSYLPKQIDVLSGPEYVAFAKEKGLEPDDMGADVNWQDEIFRTSFSHDHNVSITGGTEHSGYRASANLQNNDGIIKNSYMKKMVGRFYVRQDILNNRVHLEGSMTASRVNQRRAPLGESGGYEGDLIFSALKNNPTYPIYNEDGTYYQHSPSVRNPLALINLINDKTVTDRILANVSATVDIVKGLKYKFNYAYDYMKTSRKVTQDKELTFLGNLGEMYINNVESKNFLIENYFTYNTTINNIHKLDFLLGHSYQRYDDYWYNFSENGFDVDNINYLYNLSFGSNSQIVGTSDYLRHELQSFYGRINYNLMDKYLFTANFRFDGSTRFGENNKYGFFPSLAFAWRLSEEKFIRNLNVFDNLKLRLGYGITGNQEIPDKISELKLGSVTGAFLDGTSTVTPGITLTRTPNPDLKWEKTDQWNVGIDFGVLHNRLRGTLDWYYKSTRDVLLQTYSIAPAPTTTMWQNVPDMRIENTGVEIGLDADIIATKDWNWNFGVNFTTNHNEVKCLPMSYITVGSGSGPGLDGFRLQRIMSGHAIGTFWGYHFLGFDENGISQYETDANGNRVEKVIGCAQPDFLLNFNTTLRWKNLELSLQFNGVFGNDIYNNLDNCINTLAIFDSGYNITTGARSLKESTEDNLDYSDRYIEDGSYLRLTSATLRYTVPIKPNNWVKGVQLSLTGNNLFCITGYNGYDPEVDSRRVTDGIPAVGIGWTNYPMARSWSLGATINF